MWQNYIKTALRALWRRKAYALINVFGLSVAMGCAIVGYLNYEFNTTWDAFHTKADRIYRIGSVRTIKDEPVRHGIVPSPVEKILRSEVAGIDRVVVLDRSDATVRIGESLFNESMWFSGPELFGVFTIPLRIGSIAAFEQRTGVILSDEYAMKYFSGQDPVGKSIEVRLGAENWQSFTVSGVAAPMPKNSSIQFDILAHTEIQEASGLREPDNWKDWTGTIFIEAASEPTARRAVEHLKTSIQAQNTANPDLSVSGYYVSALRRVALESRDIRNNMLIQNPPISSFVGTLVSVAILLLLACFNYVNTSIAMAASRLKEVGVRKVVGGYRSNILRQFLGEQILLCTVALIAALGIAELLIRGWNALWSWNPLALSFTNWPLLGFLVVLIFAIAGVAGFYPAWYISRFRPALILKGQTVHARINGFMRGMLVLQFGLSLISIIQAVAFARNADYVSEIDLGYARDMRLFIPMEDVKLYEPLKNALLGDSRIVAVASSADHIGFGARRREVKMADRRAEATTYRVDAHYPSVMGLRLVRGRLFDPALVSDPGQSALINKELEATLGLEDAVGQTIEYDGARLTVVGVVDNLLHRGVWLPAPPALFKCIGEMTEALPLNYAVVQIQGGDLRSTMEFVTQTWNRLAPDRPFPGHFQDIVIAEAIKVSDNIKLMMLYLGVLAMIIAGLGLFALVSLKTVRRTKEIGVRKVLGATVGQIVGLVNREFLFLILLALVVGDALGYWLTLSLLDSIYAYHAAVGTLALVVADGVTLAIAGVTAVIIVYRAASVNPVSSLRYE